MKIIQAQRAGVQAHKDGRQSAPALNNKFLVEACSSDTDLNKLLKAYIHGWTVAHLAENALPDAPSLITLQAIMKD